LTLLAREVPVDHALLVKERDYRSMNGGDLRALARRAHRQEETAPYAKGRRAWKSFGRPPRKSYGDAALRRLRV